MPPIGDDEKTEVRFDSNQGSFPCLEILSSPRGGGRYTLRPGENRIGRSSDNDIVLDDSSVSRRHAMIRLSGSVAGSGAGNEAVISDTGSRNGTKVEGRKIDQPTSLKQGTRVKIGLFQLRYLTQEAAPESEASQAALTPEAEGLEQEPEQEGPSLEEPFPASANAGAEADIFPEGEEGLPAREGGSLRKGRKWILFGVLALCLVGTFFLVGPKILRLAGKTGKKATSRPVSEKKVAASQVVSAPAPSEDETPPKKGGSDLSPVFLEFSSTPIPARIFFGNQEIGTSPFRTSTNLAYGKWYEAKALFQLPEVGEAIEEKAQFTFPTGASVVPVNFQGKIGIFKIVSLPRDTQLYLEGYFEKDPYRAKPIKFSEIIFGKPVYVPHGRYVVELRKSRQLGMSQTFLDEVIFRREFFINADQTSYALDVNEEALKIFPVQIASIPPVAKVFIDQKEVGTTPFAGNFPVGDHLLTIKKEGYFDFVQMIKMQINMPYVAEIQLKTSEAGEFINRADALLREERATEALPILVDALTKNPSSREVAQISYMVGVCYLRQKNFKEAEDYFLKAMQHEDFKYPSRLGLSSLIFSQGDTVRALQLLVEVLVASEDPKVRADAGRLFQQVSPLKSVLYITSEPSGAKVSVNGTEVAQLTPMILHDLGVGAYRVMIRKEGYEDMEMKLNLGVSEFRPVVGKLRRVGAMP